MGFALQLSHQILRFLASVHSGVILTFLFDLNGGEIGRQDRVSKNVGFF